MVHFADRLLFPPAAQDEIRRVPLGFSAPGVPADRRQLPQAQIVGLGAERLEPKEFQPGREFVSVHRVLAFGDRLSQGQR
jgi:hypothetical protein